MFKNMKLGMKITSGFVFLILIAVFLGLIAIWNMMKVEKNSVQLANEYVPEVFFADELRSSTSSLMYEMRGFGLTGDDQYYKNAAIAIKKIEDAIADGRALQQRAPSLLTLKNQLDEADGALADYKRFIETTVEQYTERNREVQNLNKGAEDYMALAKGYITFQSEALETDIKNEFGRSNFQDIIRERAFKLEKANDVIDLGNELRINNLKYQAYNDVKYINAAKKELDNLQDLLSSILSKTERESNIKKLNELKKVAENYKNSMLHTLDIAKALSKLAVQRSEAGNKLLLACTKTAEAALNGTKKLSVEGAEALSGSIVVMVIGLVIAIIVGFLAAFFITRSITAPIRRVIEGLADGSDQVSAAAGQVSSASQTLAEGASEQAASIEETSSSLEEMSSQTKQNADNAIEADGLMKAASKVIEDADQSMKTLSSSMEEISTASQETSKIIKTIDEIAFQTNLLALNAAVEAARAGEAGAGFAVVADEVRNLAMRASEAAKNTAAMIESSVKKISDGVDLTTETNSAFGKVSESAVKVSELIAEIAAASNEQSKGIEQINMAVSQMDKVTQTNAANAEESASASEELSAQAEQMKGIVGDLSRLVNGMDDSATLSKSYKRSTGGYSAKKSGGYSPSSEKSSASFHHVPAKQTYSKSGEVSPDKIIPFDDDDDFEDWK